MCKHPWVQIPPFPLAFQHINAYFPAIAILTSVYSKEKNMHPDEFANWVKIKETFEQNGTTDNFFYVRACAIVRGEKDPIDVKSNDKT